MPIERRCRVGILTLVLLLWLGCIGAGSSGGVDSKPALPLPVAVVPYFQIPEQSDLCGEPVPLRVAEVRERFDREFTIIVNSHAQVYLWLKRKERYFPWIEKLLASQGLPDDLKFVAVAESDLMPSAVSHAGAAGPWQFMAATACNFGMTQSGAIDDRYDFEVAASGALKYLKGLSGIFQNWTLAVASYNCGEKRVQDEMKKQKANNFYFLKLPQETERYIFRILAIKEVLSNPEKYGYYLPKGEGYQPRAVDRVSIKLPGPLPIMGAAEAGGISFREFKVLNPCFISDIIPKGEFTVKVPEGKGKDFETRIAEWKAAYKPALLVHKVAKGETISAIAIKYKTTDQDISSWNNITSNKIRPGQLLKIYQ
jgi:hypothetical protein